LLIYSLQNDAVLAQVVRQPEQEREEEQVERGPDHSSEERV
jgi:hypothetical protein